MELYPLHGEVETNEEARTNEDAQTLTKPAHTGAGSYSHLEVNPPRPSFVYLKKLSGGDEACTIRLLNLHSGRPEDLICCDLQCVSLS
jgi:hypothetical protein